MRVVVVNICLVIAWCLAANVSGKNEEFKKQGNVYELTETDFDDFIQKNPKALVQFYAPWCGHCKTIAPEYETAAYKLRYKVAFAKVDATVERNLASTHGVSGYPTIKYWEDGEVTTYEGSRDADGIIDWFEDRWDPNRGKPSKEEHVLKLTAENFTSTVNEAEVILVEFYAPWCGHCKKLAPELERAAKYLKRNDPPVPIAAVDAVKEESLGSEYVSKGYPTMYIMRKGKRFEYTGPRDARGIVQYMTLQAMPAVKIFKTAHEANRNMAKHDISIIAYFDGNNEVMKKNFEAAAEELREDFHVVGYVSDPEAAETLKIPANDIAIFMPEIFRSKYEDPVVYMGNPNPTKQELIDYYLKQSVSLVGHRTVANAMKRYGSRRPMIIVYFYIDYWDMKSDLIVSRQNIGEQPNPISPSPSTEEMVHFVNKNCVPLVGHRTEKNQGRRYVNRPLVVSYFTVDFKELNVGTQYWRDKVLNVAKDYKDQYTFAISDETEFMKELETVGLGDTGSDVNVLLLGENGKKYPWDPEDDFSEETFRAFIKKYEKGKAQPYYKSAVVPKDDKGPVKTVVASTFEKVVMDSKKDVLIEFYAPWCGHCKALEPKLKQLASKLQSEKKLVIAKFDATSNDIPSQHFKVEGFPTIYFAPATKKPLDDYVPVKFDGERDVESLDKFIREHAQAAFKGKTEL